MKLGAYRLTKPHRGLQSMCLADCPTCKERRTFVAMKCVHCGTRRPVPKRAK
jgi:hypothetical protein